MYEEDLTPLNEVVDIIFNLVISNQIKVLIEKYRNDFQKNQNFRQELVVLAKDNVQTILVNFSNNYKQDILGKYFSPEGIVLVITNELISKSNKYYLDILDGINSER